MNTSETCAWKELNESNKEIKQDHSDWKLYCMQSKHWKCWRTVPVVCWWLWGGESIIAWLSKSTLLSNIDSVAVSWTRCMSCMAIINKKNAGECSPNAYCLWKSALVHQVNNSHQHPSSHCQLSVNQVSFKWRQ